MAPRRIKGRRLKRGTLDDDERTTTTYVGIRHILISVLTVAMVFQLLFQYNKYTTSTEGKYLNTPSTQENKQTVSFFQPALSNGFHPIYVYSNPQTAESEIPPPEDTVTDKVRKDTLPYSQAYQDKIVLALTKAMDAKNGNDNVNNNNNKFFVDLAANDAIVISNTLNLEQQGWKGLCIEGNPQYWYELARYRECIVIGAFVGGKEDGGQVDVSFRGGFGGIVGEQFDNKRASSQTAKRDVVSIKTVFQNANVPKVIDYLSLDVEGAESLIMESFPWDEYACRIMTIERPKDDLRQILKEHGYILIQKIVSFGETLWVHKDSSNLSIDEIKQVVGSASPLALQFQ